MTDAETIARYKMALEAIAIALTAGATGSALRIATKALESSRETNVR